MTEPLGSLCVLASADAREWTVAECQGCGERTVLRRFETQDRAAEWALEERARRAKPSGAGATQAVHFPDDCPCRGTGMTW